MAQPTHRKHNARNVRDSRDLRELRETNVIETAHTTKASKSTHHHRRHRRHAHVHNSSKDSHDANAIKLHDDVAIAASALAAARIAHSGTAHLPKSSETDVDALAPVHRAHESADHRAIMRYGPNMFARIMLTRTSRIEFQDDFGGALDDVPAPAVQNHEFAVRAQLNDDFVMPTSEDNDVLFEVDATDRRLHVQYDPRDARYDGNGVFFATEHGKDVVFTLSCNTAPTVFNQHTVVDPLKKFHYSRVHVHMLKTRELLVTVVTPDHLQHQPILSFWTSDFVYTSSMLAPQLYADYLTSLHAKQPQAPLPTLSATHSSRTSTLTVRKRIDHDVTDAKDAAAKVATSSALTSESDDLLQYEPELHSDLVITHKHVLYDTADLLADDSVGTRWHFVPFNHLTNMVHVYCEFVAFKGMCDNTLDAADAELIM